MNKISVFTAYAVMCLIGFAGVSVLSFSGKISEPTAVTAFFAFYGFLSSTALFYLLGKAGTGMEEYNRRINMFYSDTENSIETGNRLLQEEITSTNRKMEDEFRQTHNRIDDLHRDMSNDLARMWDKMDSIDSPATSER